VKNLFNLVSVTSVQDKRRRYSMMRSVESASSVFFHSQEEDPLRTGGESESFRDPLTPPEQDPGGEETSRSL